MFLKGSKYSEKSQNLVRIWRRGWSLKGKSLSVPSPGCSGLRGLCLGGKSGHHLNDRTGLIPPETGLLTSLINLS